MRILGYIILVLFASTAVGQQINPVPDYIFRYQMSVGRNAATDTAAYLSIGPRFGAVKGFQPPMVVDTASFSGSKRNGLTIFSVQKNKYVYWDSVGVKWAEMAGTAGNAITGSGTANYVPRFTTSTNLANSGIYQTPGGKIVIGSTTDSASLFNVNGTAKTGTLIVKSTTQEVRIANNFPTGRPGKNIFIGTGGQALITASGDSSSFNTALGDSAMSSLTSGWQNTAVGFEAMKNATTARSNMAFGHRALRSLTTGSANVAIGYEAMLNSQTVTNNVAIGSAAMQSTTGGNSVGVGYIALLSQTTGYNNVAIGAETIAIGTAMANTVAVGYGGLRNVTGDDNTGVGFAVMYELTTGSKNVAVGYEAGRYITSAGNNQTSTNSIYIGYDSRASANGNANEIVIGYQGRGNGSNTVTIGNSSTTSNYFTGSIRTSAPAGGTAKPWKLGTVASVSPTSPNRTIEVEIDGTTYYIHAKTTND